MTCRAVLASGHVTALRLMLVVGAVVGVPIGFVIGITLSVYILLD